MVANVAHIGENHGACHGGDGDGDGKFWKSVVSVAMEKK